MFGTHWICSYPPAQPTQGQELQGGGHRSRQTVSHTIIFYPQWEFLLPHLSFFLSLIPYTLLIKLQKKCKPKKLKEKLIIYGHVVISNSWRFFGWNIKQLMCLCMRGCWCIDSPLNTLIMHSIQANGHNKLWLCF